MKKVLTFLLAILLLITLTACSPSSNVEDTLAVATHTHTVEVTYYNCTEAHAPRVGKDPIDVEFLLSQCSECGLIVDIDYLSYSRYVEPMRKLKTDIVNGKLIKTEKIVCIDFCDSWYTFRVEMGDND